MCFGRMHAQNRESRGGRIPERDHSWIAPQARRGDGGLCLTGDERMKDAGGYWLRVIG